MAPTAAKPLTRTAATSPNDHHKARPCWGAVACWLHGATRPASAAFADYHFLAQVTGRQMVKPAAVKPREMLATVMALHKVSMKRTVRMTTVRMGRITQARTQTQQVCHAQYGK